MFLSESVCLCVRVFIFFYFDWGKGGGSPQSGRKVRLLQRRRKYIKMKGVDRFKDRKDNTPKN